MFESMPADQPDRPPCDPEGGHRVTVTKGTEERFQRLLRGWWFDERPDWVGADWWDAPVRDEVRSLLWLPAGPTLAAALAGLPGSAACPRPHPDDERVASRSPGHAPGWPCACQVVVAAAWEACASWATAGASSALVTAAGSEQVTLEAGPHSPRVVDPAREELAIALRISPNSMGNRIAAARDLHRHPELPSSSPWAYRRGPLAW